MIVGIDLGTTNVSACVIKNGKPVFVNIGDSYLLPSVVGIDDPGNFIIGEHAKNSYIEKPDSTIKSVKNYMGTDKIITLHNPLKDLKILSSYLLLFLSSVSSMLLLIHPH